MTGYSNGSVKSADGTVIGYRQLGTGPAVILLHGGMQAAQHLMKLAGVLALSFTVIVPDRRGRGLSGSHGGDHAMVREVEDVQALVAVTGATRIFGLSAGGLIALRAALAIDALDKVAVYEPPLSIRGCVPTDWLPRYDREIAAGDIASALITVLKGLGTEPLFRRIPRFLLRPLMPMALRAQRQAPEDDVPIESLVPTMRFDMALIREMADTGKECASLDARVLLLGGGRSPAYLHLALDELAAVVPTARRIEWAGLGHSGPDDDGDPVRVSEALREFFHDQPRDKTH